MTMENIDNKNLGQSVRAHQKITFHNSTSLDHYYRVLEDRLPNEEKKINSDAKITFEPKP